MKETNSTASRYRYNDTFKREAVEHWLKSGKSAEEVGRELGVGANRLYAWRQRFRPPTEAEAADLPRRLACHAEMEYRRIPSKSDEGESIAKAGLPPESSPLALQKFT